jgi:alpha-galactosidase
MPWGLALLALLPSVAFAADNGLGGKPLMGWSSWSHFHKGINEKVIQAQGDAMATRLKAFGYTYVNLDSGWRDYNKWDANGREIWDASKFPAGLPALAAALHAKGLNLGIYLHPGMDLGPNSPYELNTPIVGTSLHAQDISDMSQWGNTDKTAYKIEMSRPGAKEYIQSYADLVASWGVDYIKFDFVGPGGGLVPADNRDEMKQWSAALRATPAGSRPVWIALSNSLSFAEAALWKTVANGWRIDGDVESGASGTLTRWQNVARRFADAPRWTPFAGAGGWNDFDALPLGMGDGDGLTVDERQTTMTLWAIGCSPLILGADLTNLDPGDLALITNAEVIAVDQAGRVATPVVAGAPQQVWRAKNADGSYTVALFNLDTAPATVTADFGALGIGATATVRDLWAHIDLGAFSGGFSASLNMHASRLLHVTAAASSGSDAGAGATGPDAVDAGHGSGGSTGGSTGGSAGTGTGGSGEDVGGETGGGGAGVTGQASSGCGLAPASPANGLAVLGLLAAAALSRRRRR